jgi:hypothetical protein
VKRIFVSGFFHELSFPKTLKKTLGSFQRFSKIHGDIHNSRRITGIIYTSCKFTTSTVGVVDTGGGFGTSVNNTGVNLSPVSTTPVANNGKNIRLLTPLSELEEKSLYVC